MEHIIVRFVDDREVLVDNVPMGVVGKKLRVNAGRHTIKLRGAQNYSPSYRRPNVRGTSPSSPMEVTFEKP